MTTQVNIFTAVSDTTVRNKDDGTGGQGCGKSKHLYVGRSGASGARNYDSYIKFTPDWTGVGRIISAVLNVTTDEYDSLGPAGEIGIMAAPSTTDSPTIVINRLTSAFVEGNNTDGQFDSGDYTHPGYTTSGTVKKVMSPKGADQLITVDITAIVKAWAPVAIGGGGKTNYGIGLYGLNSTANNWSGWSREHAGGGGPSERPTITLTYSLGATVPNTPIVSAPSGAVTALTTIDGTFSDPRPTDRLQSTSIEIYDAASALGSASQSTDFITFAVAHGFHAGDAVYFSTVGTSGLVAFTKYYVLATGLTTKAFKVSTTAGTAGPVFNITATDDVAYRHQKSAFSQIAPESNRAAGTFSVPFPGEFKATVGATYSYRVRYTDEEGQTSAWTGLTSFSLTDNPPNAPTPLTPILGASFASLNAVKFQGGTFSDPDIGDYLMAHQVQLSPFPAGDARWDEADGILWDTGESYDAFGATDWTEYYGGRALAAGTYYWRARVFDQKGGASGWSYSSLVLSADFNPDPGSYTAVQINPNAPWRILIRNLYQADGVTRTVGRAPGQLVAVFEEAKNVGASIVYNSPGELHFTLLKDDEQISVVNPKQVHYAVEFYSGDGWQEKYAGVVWEMDATETDVVFKGIDYVALYDTIIDERYDPLKPNKSYKNNGSFYENVSIRTVVMDQLNWAKKQADSWVGFISIGQVDAMNEKVTIYSTMQPVLSFVAGLLDSHRQGTGKRTRLRVVKLATGGYQARIDDDPGVIRTDLAMYYGELVQGYRIIVFGDGWANVQLVVGRNRDGAKVVYKTWKGQPFQPSTSVYGRISTVAVMDGVQDQADLNRRGLQAAIQSAKLGKNIAIGIRTEFFAPLQGYDVCDVFPMVIQDGAIDTTRFGSGFWCAMAVAWEATDIGQQSLIITFMPREDATAPDPALIPSKPVSTQPEWQLGWTPPDPLKATSKFWQDQTTGKIYTRNDTTGTLTPVTGSP